MFSFQHIIWLSISAIGIIIASRLLLARRVPIERVLTAACVLAALSEIIKIFSNIQMVPAADGASMHLFMEWRHLPFHLCSIQIFLIFYVRFTESGRRRTTALAFMYPTCIASAVAALLLPSIFTNGITPDQAFTHPIAYQFFIYHSMLVVLGIYIARSGEVSITARHFWSTLALFYAFGLISIYLNSAFAFPTYTGTVLRSVENTPNFFFTFRTPINLALTEIWQWYAYVALLAALSFAVIGAFYLPFRTKR